MRVVVWLVLVMFYSSVAAAGEKAKTYVIRNPAGDIAVLSDREETIPAYFQRQRIVVGALDSETLAEVKRAEKPLEKRFVNYTSHNDDNAKTGLFGGNHTLAPLSREAAKLLEERKPAKGEADNVQIVLRRDAKDMELFHVVGVLRRSPVSFFERTEVEGKDGFSPKDLRFKGE